MPSTSGQTSGSTAVNLSRLPFPAVIEALDYDTILAGLKADLIALVPTVELALVIPSDPLTKLLELFAYRELMLRARINDEAKSVMIAYAVGSDLDNLVALLGVERLKLVPANEQTGAPAVMEADDELRRRAILAPEGFSVAGPEGAYVYWALSADPDVADASCISPDPGEVVVTVLSRAAGGVPSAELLEAVEAAVNDEEVRPLTDQVTVQAAEILPFTVVASIKTFGGPDSGLVMTEARARLDAYLVESFRLGRDPTRSALIAALHAEGVHSVTLTQPAASIVASRVQAALCTDVALTYAGVDE